MSEPLRAPAPPLPTLDSAIRVLLFGSLREQMGMEVLVPLAGGTVSDVWESVTARCAGSRPSRAGLRCARNLEYCSWDDVVQPGDELAFMPPVCGGSTDHDGITVALTGAPIDAGALLKGTGGDEDGAVACFVGRVRNHSNGAVIHALDYEAYAPMALSMMRTIARDARARHGLSTIVLVHRVGALAVGAVAVVVVASSAHRAAALDACSEVVEAVKADVPIWKREHTAAGARWVDARSAVGTHV
ncbi:MAG: molybdenum cofactor biosynthesis protein MoaE [Candidatus Dormibacteraeota bacterium]|uniref:Molybdenum cofactor biosynthesis protein MoaE n=1 Tax=Candidatus Aeolococcus gillhamiae TaxID=3127015 RepID=A0A934K176_9BACT|nr:molybdenum cofactor biosynthesis protein MoaE [Candidatus Dormibacteraeota bacterium]